MGCAIRIWNSALVDDVGNIGKGAVMVVPDVEVHLVLAVCALHMKAVVQVLLYQCPTYSHDGT